VLYGAAGWIAGRLEFRQAPGRLDLARIPADIVEGLAIVRGHKVMLGVILVTIITNAFAFSYSALIAPLGLERYGVSPALVGLLAAAEPLGAVTAGLCMATGLVRMDRPRMMIGGSFVFLVALAAVSVTPWYGLAFVLLLIGGLGTAAFSSMQSTLMLTHAPPALRSRVMGLVTVCIGVGPVGVLGIGMLSDWLGAGTALLTMAVLGMAALGLAALQWPAQTA
jgi:predicted MFS family arabinose efflux permease